MTFYVWHGYDHDGEYLPATPEGITDEMVRGGERGLAEIRKAWPNSIPDEILVRAILAGCLQGPSQ